MNFPNSARRKRWPRRSVSIANTARVRLPRATTSGPSEHARTIPPLNVPQSSSCPPLLFDWFVPCPRGLEAPLAAELSEIGERHVANAPLSGGGSLIVGAQVPGGVHFRGGWAAGMAANLHSRIASRVLLKVAQGAYRSEHDIYELRISSDGSNGSRPARRCASISPRSNRRCSSLEFATLRVKDAVCDRLREVSRRAAEHRYRAARRPRLRVPHDERMHALSRHLRRTALQARLASGQRRRAAARKSRGRHPAPDWLDARHAALRSDVRQRHLPRRSGANRAEHRAGQRPALRLRKAEAVHPGVAEAEDAPLSKQRAPPAPRKPS